MSHKRKDNYAVYLCILMLGTITATVSGEPDIDCLKSIKDSLEDPNGYLSSSWDFNDNTPGFVCRFDGVECWNGMENRVINLKLFSMGLKGQLPSGIGNCTSLQSLDLSANELHGSIPYALFELSYLVEIDLSFNSFTGTIPASIANCNYLNVLKLNDNYLTGEIPAKIGKLRRLKEFSVANNMLSGQIPNFVNTNFSKESYVDNNGLCGGPLEKCSPRRSFAGGFAVGYGVSVCTVMVVYASYFVPWLKFDKHNKITIAAMLLLIMRRRKIKKGEVHQLVNLSTDGILDTQILSLEQMGVMVQRLQYADMSRATDNFSDNTVIGVGKTGTMYKATLPHGHLFVVKKLHNYGSLGERFISELRILGSLRHINLLPLLGFCTTSTDKLLVYKYMPNGNLYDWLHPNIEGEVKVMEWPGRVKVAIGLARGLAWLHEGTNIRIIHLDFCSKKCVA